jgi:hypothetical protein
MKAIKINTDIQKIEIVEIGDWKDIAPAIGNGCTTFCCPVTFDNKDTIYADDEGLYNDFKGGFMLEGWAYPLVGNAIVLGTNNRGGSIDAKSTIEELENAIIWVYCSRL